MILVLYFLSAVGPLCVNANSTFCLDMTVYSGSLSPPSPLLPYWGEQEQHLSIIRVQNEKE